MSGFFLNTVVSAVVGVLAAVGTTWYISAQTGANKLASQGGEPVKVKSLEVDSLTVNDSLLLVDPVAKNVLIELRNGEIFAQKGVYSDHIGAWSLTAQRLQTTPEDPLDPSSPVFGELAVNEDGGGYLALMSPQESHSLTMGFDRYEKGCVVSQNNLDNSRVAQAVFLKPTRNATTGVAPASAASGPAANAVARPDALRSVDARYDSFDNSIRR